MSKALITEAYLTDIADAIRAKNGSSDTYTPPQMAAAIAAIPTGGDVTVEALSVTQNGTYTAPTGKAYSPVTVNVSGGGGGGVLVANWDFTQSLVDSVSGMVAELGGECTQDSGGLHFTGARQYATLNGTNVWTWFPGRLIELDIAAMDLQGNNSAHYTLITNHSPTETTAWGFLYRNTGVWAFYDGSWHGSNITEKNYWDEKTLGIYLTGNNTAKVYSNGTLVDTVPYSNTTKRVVLGNGRTQSEGGQIFNTTITGCRIYQGNPYN